MDRITQALEWAEKRMAGWEPFTKNQMEILHFAFHELKQLHKPVVVRPTSDLSEGGGLLQGEAEEKGVSDGDCYCNQFCGYEGVCVCSNGMSEADRA